MIIYKTPKEIEIMREGGKRLAFILKEVAKKVVPGVSTKDLNDFAYALMKEGGDTPSFLNYTPYGAKRPYPAALCVSVNEEIVHGIPNENPKILKDGDIVTIDAGLTHKGFITDHAITLPVGEIPKELKKLLSATQEALMNGIRHARVGGHVGDIGAAVQEVAEKYGFAVVEDLCGHGVGKKVHEDPYVPNTGKKGTGEKLEVGMVIAVEPMFSLGTSKPKVLRDGYTYVTRDGSLSAHFEHTIAFTEKGTEILTK